MKIYRGFRYDIRRLDEATWEWNVYGKNEDAPRLGGMRKANTRQSEPVKTPSINGLNAQTRTQPTDEIRH